MHLQQLWSAIVEGKPARIPFILARDGVTNTLRAALEQRGNDIILLFAHARKIKLQCKRISGPCRHRFGKDKKRVQKPDTGVLVGSSGFWNGRAGDHE